ncbi:MAG: hypothetical protein HYU66_23330 [Armatimonadetes bacterium]|nr:hypothetical protein [Armatimonadota bacterium]
MTIQDCRVEGWTAADGAIRLTGAPAILFDCGFTGGPAGSAPVFARDGLRLFLSHNTWDGGPDILQASNKARVYAVPDGNRRGVLRAASQRFLRDTVPAPGKLFDAKADFGAKADGQTDDTAALQACIDAARQAGGGATAYLPTGWYAITAPLQLTGADYHVGGSGFHTHLLWHGPEGGTMIEVRAPQNITLEHLAVGNHDSGQMNNAVDICTSGSRSARGWCCATSAPARWW